MTAQKKIKVAITGNIGSGKTTFTRYIFESGYPVIFADDISKEILAHDPKVKAEIIKEFGEHAFNGKKVNKQYLSDEIFSNPNKLKRINSILHPRVRIRIEQLTNEFYKNNNIVFVETALIFESKIEKMFDYIVLITADKDLRLKRSILSKNLSKEEFLKRNFNQISEDIKKKKAHFIFSNNDSKYNLKQKAILLTTLLNSTLN